MEIIHIPVHSSRNYVLLIQEGKVSLVCFEDGKVQNACTSHCCLDPIDRQVVMSAVNAAISAGKIAHNQKVGWVSDWSDHIRTIKRGHGGALEADRFEFAPCSDISLQMQFQIAQSIGVVNVFRFLRRHSIHRLRFVWASERGLCERRNRAWI